MSFHSRHALVASLLLLGACSRTPQAAGPNLLLVTLDTVRADHLGAYGSKEAETPNLDRLAAEGVRFLNAMTVAPLTLPAHATLLSGLRPPAHGVHSNGGQTFPSNLATLATRAQAAGYATAAFVGSFVLDHRFGLARGFDRYDDDIPRAIGTASLEAERPGSLVVDRALAWLREPRTKPFLLWVHLYDAHAPYTPPEPFASRHAGDPYAGEIAGVDAQVGRLITALAENGVLDATVISVVADHGEALGEHGELTHGLLLYEPTVRVPWILRAAGSLPAGTAIARPVSSADVAPTLAGLLAWPPPPTPVDGRDLSAALRDGVEPAPADIYAETEYPSIFGWGALHALRRGDRKLISGPRSRLFDLATDPREEIDLLPANRQAATNLETSLAAARRHAAENVSTPPSSLPDADTRARLASLGYSSGMSTSGPGSRAANADLEIDPEGMAPAFRAYEEARGSERAGRSSEARRALEPLVAADPRNPIFQSELGLALRGEGNSLAALAPYRRATELTPSDPEAWYNLAVTLRETGAVVESADALRQTLRLAPDHVEAHNALGVALSMSGDLAGAAAEFQRASALDAHNATALNNLGNALRSLGRLDASAAAYEQALALSPSYADALNGLGALEVARQRPAAGLPLFEQALALEPGKPEIALNRAVALELLGRRQDAASAYRSFLAATEHDDEFAAQREAVRLRLTRLTSDAASNGGR